MLFVRAGSTSVCGISVCLLCEWSLAHARPRACALLLTIDLPYLTDVAVATTLTTRPCHPRLLRAVLVVNLHAYD